MKTSPCTERRVALFPGSFDPLTRGHESIVRRALPLFDEVVVAIGINSGKHCLLTAAQRLALAQSVFAGEPRVRVIVYEGLTVDAARQCGAQYLLRGVRTVADFEGEMLLAQANRDLAGIDTVLLYSLPELGHVSSTLVRELLRYGHPVDNLMPDNADMHIIDEAARTMQQQ